MCLYCLRQHSIRCSFDFLRLQLWEFSSVNWLMCYCWPLCRCHFYLRNTLKVSKRQKSNLASLLHLLQGTRGRGLIWNSVIHVIDFYKAVWWCSDSHNFISYITTCLVNLLVSTEKLTLARSKLTLQFGTFNEFYMWMTFLVRDKQVSCKFLLAKLSREFKSSELEMNF